MIRSDLDKRRKELHFAMIIDRVTYAYNKAVFAVGGYDIDADPSVVSERQWRATKRMAATFIAAGGKMSAADVRHEWEIELSMEGHAAHLSHDLFVPFEDLCATDQFMELSGTEAMRAALRGPLVIENHQAMDDGQLQWVAHSHDDQIGLMELVRRRALKALGHPNA